MTAEPAQTVNAGDIPPAEPPPKNRGGRPRKDGSPAQPRQRPPSPTPPSPAAPEPPRGEPLQRDACVALVQASLNAVSAASGDARFAMLAATPHAVNVGNAVYEVGVAFDFTVDPRVLAVLGLVVASGMAYAAFMALPVPVPAATSTQPAAESRGEGITTE